MSASGSCSYSMAAQSCQGQVGLSKDGDGTVTTREQVSEEQCMGSDEASVVIYKALLYKLSSLLA